MRKFISNMKAKFNSAVQNVKAGMARGRATLAAKTGEGYIDTALKIIIGVVIGGVILAGLYTLFNVTILPTLTTKITEMFTYAG